MVGVKMFLAVALAVAVLTVSPGRASADDTCQPNPYGVPGCMPTGGVYVPPPPAPIPNGPPREPAPHPFTHPEGELGPGHDVRPCVSVREYRGAKGGWTRAETEGRWEVTGLGRPRIFPIVGQALAYPACGFDKDQALCGAVYKDGMLVMAVRFAQRGAKPHGRP